MVGRYTLNMGTVIAARAREKGRPIDMRLIYASRWPDGAEFMPEAILPTVPE
jgi:hypothetical protein